MEPDNSLLKPLNEDTDARRWADEFFMAWNRNLKPDYDWMVAWFANAIMCGSDVMRWKMEKEIDRLRAELSKAEAERDDFREKFHDLLHKSLSEANER